MNDNVTHPAHYTAGGIECIEAIKAMLQGYTDSVLGWLAGQVVKYVWRAPLKGKQLEDLKKARFYLDRMIKEAESSEGAHD